jgi:putative addiction module killer protein
MNTIIRTATFDAWLSSLKDMTGKARILQRLDSFQRGNFGNCEPVGDGVSELKIHTGPGYRVYFARRGAVVYLLLLGGDKSTQKKDIIRAQEMLKNLPKE